MKAYNGFQPKQRYAALRWLRAEQAAGRRPAHPTACMACGQQDGILDFHSEDYSEPFGAHIGAYELCFACHLSLHCRFSRPQAFQLYVGLIDAGHRLKPYPSRNFRQLMADFDALQSGDRARLAPRLQACTGGRPQVLTEAASDLIVAFPAVA